jgi:hypothetical protein
VSSFERKTVSKLQEGTLVYVKNHRFRCPWHTNKPKCGTRKNEQHALELLRTGGSHPIRAQHLALLKVLPNIGALVHGHGDQVVSANPNLPPAPARRYRAAPGSLPPCSLGVPSPQPPLPPPRASQGKAWEARRRLSSVADRGVQWRPASPSKDGDAGWWRPGRGF